MKAGSPPSHGGYPFVIWGSGGTAKKLADVVWACGQEVVALFDNNPDAKSVLDGVPIYYGESGLKAWTMEHQGAMPCAALVGAGAAPGGERLALLNLLSSHGFLTPPIAHPTAWISPRANLSRGSVVFAQGIIDANAVVGDACIINDAARVGHDCIVGNGVHLAPGAVLLGGARIGDHVLIGANAVIMPHLVVGSGAKVGAGAVVLADVPSGATVVGNPARIVQAAKNG
jgi:sugar O-acyltransferase (sialic acid O-acetyltransferase NeuD family)